MDPILKKFTLNNLIPNRLLKIHLKNTQSSNGSIKKIHFKKHGLY